MLSLAHFAALFFLQEQMNSSMQNKKNALMIFMTGL